MMFQNGILGLASEDVFIASVGRCRLLIELLFIERQRFVSDVVVSIRSAAVTALGKYVEHVTIGEADAILKRHDVLIRLIPALNGSATNHIVTGLADRIPLFVTEHLQHLECRGQRFSERLPNGSLCECGNTSRHEPDIIIYHGTGNE
ncbi:hypothetical protein [uncultured Bacteroides sp.]|uniref:hypothetical protein n=1 Tax=uncultured Bacteroides sp. TaxID=162156 RepID=UPI002583913B|nr:hypothetical protein [uncultured Bacteroides sp.]